MLRWLHLLSFAIAISASMSITASCSHSLSARCRKLCEPAADCAKQPKHKDFVFDLDECTAACDNLLRSAEAKDLVDRYETCISKSESCSDIRSCQTRY